MSARPVPRHGVMSIDAYVPGKSAAPAGVKVHKLSSNETPLGPSPKAVEAASTAMGKLAYYPDGSTTRLRDAIAHKFGLDPARIVCGNGSDELLSLLTLSYVGPGDEGVFCEHGFLVYRIAILAAGGTPVVAKERELTADVDAILAAVTPRTKIVYLANPNNPTGTYISFEEVKRLHSGLPPHVLLVLDAAYAEYVRRNDYAAGLELVMTSENVVMTRTFSKIHGLAQLRLGWMFAPAHVVDAVNRIRPAVQRQRRGDRGRHRRDRRRRTRGGIGDAQRHLARYPHPRARGDRPRRDAERGEFPARPFPAGGRADGACGGRIPDLARHDPAADGRLRPAARAAPHHRHGGGQPSRRGEPEGIHGGEGENRCLTASARLSTDRSSIASR
jgi:hypothetical protein